MLLKATLAITLSPGFLEPRILGLSLGWVGSKLVLNGHAAGISSPYHEFWLESGIDAEDNE